jgi:hypothetical protein
MKLIVNCKTGKTVERDLNDAEIEQERIDNLAFEIVKSEAEAKATARASALAKLAALGLSADEIAAL